MYRGEISSVIIAEKRKSDKRGCGFKVVLSLLVSLRIHYTESLSVLQSDNCLCVCVRVRAGCNSNGLSRLCWGALCLPVRGGAEKCITSAHLRLVYTYVKY